MVSLLVTYIVSGAGFALAEPISPNTLTGDFVYGAARTGDIGRYHIRLLSEYRNLSDAPDTDHTLSTTVSGMLDFGGGWIGQAAFQARSMLMEAGRGVPDRLMIRGGYAPTLTSKLTFGATLGAGLVADSTRPDFGKARYGGEVAAYVGSAYERLAWALDVRADVLTRPPGDSGAMRVGGGAMTSINLTPMPMLIVAEAQGRVDPSQDEGWSMLGLVGLSSRSFYGAQIVLAGTLEVGPSSTTRPGAVFAISGILGGEDSDSDGIPDVEDACAGIAGSAEYQGCVFEDADGDSVWDRLDACPNTTGDKDNAGCPWTDTDGDGVPDANETDGA